LNEKDLQGKLSAVETSFDALKQTVMGTGLPVLHHELELQFRTSASDKLFHDKCGPPQVFIHGRDIVDIGLLVLFFQSFFSVFPLLPLEEI